MKKDNASSVLMEFILDLTDNYDLKQRRDFSTNIIDPNSIFPKAVSCDYVLERKLTMMEKTCLQLIVDYVGRSAYASTDLAVTGHASSTKLRTIIQRDAERYDRIAKEIKCILSKLLRGIQEKSFYVEDGKLYTENDEKLCNVYQYNKLSKANWLRMFLRMKPKTKVQLKEYVDAFFQGSPKRKEALEKILRSIDDPFLWSGFFWNIAANYDDDVRAWLKKEFRPISAGFSSELKRVIVENTYVPPKFSEIIRDILN